MNPRRLYRSRRERQLAGVAGGMAEYLEMDPTVVRILWILSFFLGGFTLILYVVLALIVPLEPFAFGAGPTTGGAPGADPASEGTAGVAWQAPEPAWRREHRPGRGGLFLGVLLVVFGSIALVNAAIPGWIGGAALGPAFLLALGVALVVGAIRHTATEP